MRKIVCAVVCGALLLVIPAAVAIGDSPLLREHAGLKVDGLKKIVNADAENLDISYTPHYSRLFFGFSHLVSWYSKSVEFYPVNYPVYWENTSNDTRGLNFSWLYENLDESGNIATFTGEDRNMLEVTFHPNYSSLETLRNNMYSLPQLRVSDMVGVDASYTDVYDCLQAGGRPEAIDIWDGPVPDSHGESYVVVEKYTATNFDMLHEGMRVHTANNEAKGLHEVPIFGHNADTDNWWVNYCFQHTGTAGKYAYVDGFANLYLPHPEAPLVVNGFKVVAKGDLTGAEEVPFTLKVYKMTEEGELVEAPIAQKTILGSEITVLSGVSPYRLMLEFPLDASVIFDAEGTGYGYMVEVSGYHDERVQYFAPMQTAEPNKHEWALGFYHLHSSLADIYPNYTFSDSFGYVANLYDDQGREMYSSFYIGLDACYPWLQFDADRENAFSFSDEGATLFDVQGYYEADQYTVELPEGYEASLQGEYTIHVSVTPDEPLADDVEIPMTLTAPGVSLTVNVPLKKDSGIETVEAEDIRGGNVYNAQGMLLKRNAEDIESLPAGIYIVNGKKVLIKN